MPRVKRWFPISRDIFSDPQYGELVEQFGHAGFALWSAFLKMAEDDEGVIVAMSYRGLSSSMASLARVDPEIGEAALRLFVRWEWVTQEWYESANGGSRLVFRAANYDKYHPKQSMRVVQSTKTAPKNGRRNRPEGAIRINRDGYPQRVIDGKWKLVHILIAERALGKKLPSGTQVWQVNGVKTDAQNTNLVICNDLEHSELLKKRRDNLFEMTPSGEFIRRE